MTRPQLEASTFKCRGAAWAGRHNMPAVDDATLCPVAALAVWFAFVAAARRAAGCRRSRRSRRIVGRYMWPAWAWWFGRRSLLVAQSVAGRRRSIVIGHRASSVAVGSPLDRSSFVVRCSLARRRGASFIVRCVLRTNRRSFSFRSIRSFVRCENENEFVRNNDDVQQRGN